jgi:hypothetical protein
VRCSNGFWRLATERAEGPHAKAQRESIEGAIGKPAISGSHVFFAPSRLCVRLLATFKRFRLLPVLIMGNYCVQGCVVEADSGLCSRTGYILPEGQLAVGEESLESLGHGYYVYGLPDESMPPGQMAREHNRLRLDCLPAKASSVTLTHTNKSGVGG